MAWGWSAVVVFTLVCGACAVARSAAAASAAPVAVATCGNGHLDPGESCDACAADCTVHHCTPHGAPHPFAVRLSAPLGSEISAVTLLIGYDSRRVSIPGRGQVDSVRKRIGNVPKNATPVANDLDYALRIVISRAQGLEPGPLLTLSVDACKGSEQPKAEHFGCTVEGCASRFGPTAGCTCTVTAP